MQARIFYPTVDESLAGLAAVTQDISSATGSDLVLRTAFNVVSATLSVRLVNIDRQASESPPAQPPALAAPAEAAARRR